MSSQGSPIDYPAVLLTHKAVAEFRQCLSVLPNRP
jgi:hypothetical protein